MTFAENNRISHRQLYRQLILSFTAPFLLCLFQGRRLTGVMGILGTALAVILLLFYVIFLIRLAPKFENLQKSCGRFLSWILGIFFLIYTILTAAYLLSVLMQIVPESLLEGVLKPLIGLLALVVCVFGSQYGMQRRGRMAELSGALLFIVVLLMMALSLGQAKISYLQEMFLRSSRSFDSLWSNGYGVLCAFSGIALLPFLLPHVEKSGSAWRPAAFGILTVGAILEGMLLLLPAVFGWDRLKAEEMPILPLLAGANLPGGILARFDVLWMGFVLYGLLYTIGSMFHYSHQVFRAAFLNTVKPDQTGFYRSFFFAAAAGIFSLLEVGGLRIQNYYLNYLGAIFVPGVLLLQVLILFIGKEQRKKRLTTVATVLVFLFISGCAGIEPEKRMLPLALGVQQEADNLVVSYAMPNLQKMTGQGKEEEGKNSGVLTFRGRSFGEVRKAYEESQEKYLDLGHLQVLILEDAMLETKNWRRVLSYLQEERMTGENMYVFTAENPSQILEWQKKSGTSAGEYLVGVLEDNTTSKKDKGVTLRDVYYDWYRNGQVTPLPEVEVDGDSLKIDSLLYAAAPKQFLQNPPVMAWWGSLYPKFCFGEVEKESAAKSDEVRPKISFYLAKLLDW